MSPTVYFAAQVVTHTLIFGLVARWYVAPWVARTSFRDAATPLLLFQGIRTLGFVFLVPGVTGGALPHDWAFQGAWGDAVAALLALLTLAAVRARSPLARPLGWLLVVEGFLDFGNAFGHGIAKNISGTYPLGAAWFLPTFLVPALFWGLVIFYQLLRRPVPRAA